MTESLGVRRAGGEPPAESGQPKPDAETATLNRWVQGLRAQPVCPDPESLSSLRKQLRQQRRALPESLRKAFSRRAASHFLQAFPRIHEKKIALFWPTDGELDPRPLVQTLWQRGHRQLYLPVLNQPLPQSMRFARWTPETVLKPNRYGIPEPFSIPTLPGCRLDLIITPLVAFDARGVRLGMGGGYYDRTFACLRWRSLPKLIGWAYGFQEVPYLPQRPWDIPLYGIVTEQGFRRFSPSIPSDAERADSPDCPAR